MAEPDNSTRTCKTCGTEKPLTEFYLRKDNGLPRHECKVCLRARTMERKGGPKKRKGTPTDYGTKVCSKCGQEKPLDQFYKRSDNDSYRSHCKACQEADRAEHAEENAERTRKWREANPDKASETCRNWRMSNMEYVRAYNRSEGRVESKRLSSKKSYRLYRTERIERQRIYTLANKEKVDAYQRQYWRDNPEKASAYKAKRRAQKRAAGGSHTAADIKDLYAKQKGRCVACGKALRGKYHVDHIQPLAKGGSNAKENLQLLCAPCNCSKRAKDPIDFMQERGFLL